MTTPSIWLAFLAGLASFLSPCVFALVPAYVGYLGGRSTAGTSGVGKTFSHAVAFVFGFSAVFILLGLFSAALGSFLYSFSRIIAVVGGLIVVLFGLHLTGILHIHWLDYDLRPQVQANLPRTYLSSMLIGVFFSAGWVPCVGPVLGAILTLALNHGSISEGGILLTAYSLGLAIPFLLAATQISWITSAVRRYGKLSHYIQLVTGVALIAFGLLLASGRLSTLASFGFFFETIDESRIGLLLLIGFAAALLFGAIYSYFSARNKKPKLESWFLAAGVAFLGIIVLYLSGIFTALGLI